MRMQVKNTIYQSTRKTFVTLIALLLYRLTLKQNSNSHQLKITYLSVH